MYHILIFIMLFLDLKIHLINLFLQLKFKIF